MKSAGREVRLGDELFVMPARKGPRGGVHRAHFLDELVKLIPHSVAQFRKKLTDVTKAQDGSGLFQQFPYPIFRDYMTNISS
jgi:salicylate hydroxylase